MFDHDEMIRYSVVYTDLPGFNSNTSLISDIADIAIYWSQTMMLSVNHITRLLTKTNKLAVARLRPTERVKTARTQCSSPTNSLFAESPDSLSSSRPDSGAEKRRLLRPPSAPVRRFSFTLSLPLSTVSYFLLLSISLHFCVEL